MKICKWDPFSPSQDTRHTKSYLKWIKSIWSHKRGRMTDLFQGKFRWKIAHLKKGLSNDKTVWSLKSHFLIKEKFQSFQTETWHPDTRGEIRMAISLEKENPNKTKNWIEFSRRNQSLLILVGRSRLNMTEIKM